MAAHARPNPRGTTLRLSRASSWLLLGSSWQRWRHALQVQVAPNRRLLTTHITAADAAQQLLAQSQNAPPVARTQVLDGNQLRKLSLTLGRPHLHPGLDLSSLSISSSAGGTGSGPSPPPPLPRGTPLPPAYHLVYFTPCDLETDLGPDGTDRAFNAPAPYTRRMWAGGCMRWPGGEGRELRVGEVVEERTRLVSAVPKRSSRDGSEMVLVEVEKEFWAERGLAVVDQR